jgi:hypothetical protein
VSLVPEYILQQVLVKGFRAFRENEDLVRVLFRSLEQSDLEDVVKFFQKNTIDICINYPDKDLVLPAIAILMGNETESDPSLGDYHHGAKDYRELEQAPFPREELLGSQTVLGAGSMAPVGGPAGAGEILMSPVTALGGTSTTITAPSSTTLLIDPFEEPTVTAVVLEGLGEGQRRTVVDITPSLSGGPVIIEVAPAWDTTPDATSVFMLVGEADPVGYTGEPAKLYTTSDNVESLGQIYEAKYRLDILAYPQELTIYLYAMMKAIFTVSRKSLEKHGLIVFTMAGTDLGPMPEFYPQKAYRRSMNVTFKYAFDVVKEIEQAVATQLQLALTVHHPDVDDVDDVERATITTSFSAP